MEKPLLVAVIDDDESVRESLPDLLNEFGFAVQAFSSARAFLTSAHVADTRCLILDVAMPAMSGPELHKTLKLHGHAIPVIFITAQGDAGERQKLLRNGAVECLMKPFSEAQLLTALSAALPVD
ncbi:response regulator [Pseudomonas fluorescens]|uniref:response regulator transcription factor n=1 Tax=Pseudomonas fluorescens TaxID=294 RepID=UPI00003880BB|nr:response regulator [Pseudomonas fluorescens]MBY9022637.1 response regulator [Pseudomonas fluorescens]MBY9028629.1 response regulator [Pseudomonas fluorescens]MBY9033812.1 response regulator [Pseudomonas fluorescens]MBY9040279.1 response regulator [Pseudomonas fluorescens]MBY9045712.1 response regulator [Pseudomonas fluorescens]